MAIEKIVGVRDQRGALADECYVGGAKIADGGNSGADGDDGGLADLQCGRRGVAEIGRGLP